MEDRLAALEQRIARLERQAEMPHDERLDAPRSSSALELAQQFRERATENGAAGTVAYQGAVHVNGLEYTWAGEHEVDDLMAADWTHTAAVLEAMGSPPRLALLGRLVGGTCTSAELQETLGGENSTGHLYHHLRELQRAGLITQRRRGAYEMYPQAVIPLLAILAAALDLRPGDPVAGTSPDLGPGDPGTITAGPAQP
ncbi:ArsR/SmtB family transcription factor [Rhizohabitans arisaemae]|uniref:ArsR/SmtB family transcription factor n=1 Tax=Rhizohabitans arisaemae TaxID=2720610 RepID=UPI0024B0BACC|nr:helix-turn-helix domain-containing protein [Rhizohabitans arisaemae]